MNKADKGLSLTDLFTLGFGAIVGVGWSVTLNNIFINGGGPIPAIIGFVLATLCFIPIALCFAELTPALPKTGGVIVHAGRAFKPSVAFVAGWFVSMAYISILPWEAININEIIAYIFPALDSGPVLYTMLGENIYLRTSLVGVAMTLLVFFLNWRGVESAAGFQKFTTFLLIGGSVVCVVFALAKCDLSNIRPLYSPMSGKSHSTFFTGVVTMLALAPFYYSGFDTIPQSAEEAGNVNRKAMGRVIIATMAFAGLFYVLIFLSAGLAYPWTETVGLARPVLSNMFLYLYPGPLGKVLYSICTVATLAGLFSTWNGFFIAGARLLHGMGRDHLIPAVFAKMHPKYNTPYVGNIFCGVLMLLGPFLGTGFIDPLVTLSSSGYVIGWGLVCLSAARLRQTEPDLPRPYKMPGGRKTAYLGFFLCALIFLNCVLPFMPGYMGKIGMYTFAVWTLLGILFYYATRNQRNAVRKRPA